MRPLQPRESFKYSVTAAVVGSSEQAPTFRLLSRSRNIPCATRYCEPATAGQVSSSESEHCYFGTGGSDLLFIFATVPRESEHTLCHAVLRARNSWQVSSSESEHCYFGTGGSDLLFIFATVPRPEQQSLNLCEESIQDLLIEPDLRKDDSSYDPDDNADNSKSDHRSLTSCGIPSLLEPSGISRADGKRPDGLTLIPWSRGKSSIWDSTCVDTLAPAHLPNTSRRAACAAELAVKKKVNKYARLLDNNYIFVPFAVETFGPWSHDDKVLVSQISQILISITDDRRYTTYLRQRLSIAIQRGNAMIVLSTLPEPSPLDALFLL
ncbi:hypothetical protein ANN_26613 [Periplaneta americana]|uniref:Uncharacterized protein n=1 Tax=Periplaneta americana TaxID=6978 RepID=A0ABQ8RYT9_PERAM|nr:hypothetical protein ANN_26613 [Periplaneta americana]